MTETVLRPNTQAEIDALNAGRTIAGEQRPQVFGTNANQKTYFAAFEGTRNNQNDASMGQITNVAAIFNQAAETIRTTGSGEAKYYPGAGTQGALRLIDSGAGSTIPFTARRAADDFTAWAQKQFEVNANVEIQLAGASYSRGTITHTAYLNNVYNDGVGKRGTEIYGDFNNPTQITGYSQHWIAPKTMNLGMHFMYDRVAGPINSAGSIGVVVPPDPSLRIFHAKAGEEHRREFASESLFGLNGVLDPRFIELDFAAAHANIGGNTSNRGISLYTLDMNMQWFKSYGLNLGTLPSEYQIGNAPLLIDNSYLDFSNGANGVGGPGSPNWTVRSTNTNRYWQTSQTGAGATQNGTETNLINLSTTTSTNPTQTAAPEATNGGPSANNTTGLGGNSNYSFGIAPGNWNVNTASGNQALAGYMPTEGFRPGNGGIGLNINASSGIGLKIPVFTGNTDPLAGPVDYSMLGNTVNNAAQSNFFQVPVDPLVLDLNGDGVKLTNFTDAPVLFDADNDGGSLEQTGWVSNEDGIVVHDLNNDGKINNISETLSEYYNGVAGSNGVAGTKPFANGFAALKSLDSNNDNQFTSTDAAWSQLKVWQDANHDGKTDAGELKTFAQLGITAINLNSTSQSGEVRDGNAVLARGTFTQTVNSVSTTREAIAANFIANPAGSTITQGSNGITVATEGLAGTGATSAYVSTNTVTTVNESLTASTLLVKNITGGAGADTITGDSQNNWLAGSLGADKLYGGAGDDVLLIDSQDTVIDGGAGLDIAQVVGNQGVTLNLSQSNIEIAVGGDGNDVFIGGGRSTVFIRGGAGDDLIIGGAANDVLSGEDGDDLIDGGAGNDLIRGHRGQDQLLGGQGDDVIDGGLEDDSLSGGIGNDVLIGGRGDDNINGGDGIDVAQYSGSYADYRITKIKDAASGGTTFRVVDTRTGQDGADTLTNIEKLSFSDVSRVDLTLAAPLPAKDILAVNSTGQALSRTAPHLISKTQLLQNDRDWDSDVSQLSITAVLEAKGGTVSLTQSGDVLFTPDATYTGVMGFKYTVQDAQGNYTQVTSPTGQTVAMKAAVYLQTSDIPNDPLAVEQWYLADTNVFAAWGTAAEQAAGQGYSGKGIKIGQFEPGGPFSTGPEVFDYRHPDPAPNADKAWLNTLDSQGNNITPQTFSNHATMVAGVMVAARNGEGGVGVAYNASLAGHYIQGEGLEVTQLNAEITAALAKFKNYDVVNNSWGATSNFLLNFAQGNHYQKRSCLRTYLLGYGHKRPANHAPKSLKTTRHAQKSGYADKKATNLEGKYASKPMYICASSYEKHSNYWKTIEKIQLSQWHRTTRRS